MKKFFLVLVCMMNTLWASAQFSGSGSGTAQDPYLIFNPIQLAQMANFLNNTDVVFELKADLSLTDFINENYPSDGWQPIGANSSNAFKGIFKGNGHSISGLRFDKPNESKMGLFGHLSSATISDVILKDCDINGGAFTGSLAGECADCSTIQNVVVESHVQGSTYIGGIVGVARTSQIEGCKWKGTIYARGIRCGGIVGFLDGGKCNNCYARGNIFQRTGAEQCGGVVGEATSSTSGYSYEIASDIVECTFVGNIDITSQSTVNSTSGSYSTGGIVGRIRGGSHLISKCVALANIKGVNSVGGVCGHCESEWTPSFIDCYFSGEVSGKENVGGITGTGQGSIRNCYVGGFVKGETNVGGIVGSSTKKKMQINSCVSLVTEVNASHSGAGRIYGNDINKLITLGAKGSADANLALATASIVVDGVIQSIQDGNQNGYSIGPSMLKLKATYVGKGWDFVNNWAIQESECFPYFPYQVAPPIIESDVASGTTTISGLSVDDGVVCLYDETGLIGKANCNSSHEWTITTKPLQSGKKLYVNVEKDGFLPSYFVSAMVSFAGRGTETDPYRIYSADDLHSISTAGYYLLMNDIDLTKWINDNSSTKGWSGAAEGSGIHIDGAGHKIIGLWSNTDEENAGLFARIHNSSIKNLIVNVASGKKMVAGNHVGILVGHVSDGIIENVEINGDVSSTAAGARVGGIAGYASNCTVSACRVKGSVSASMDNACVGGAFGEASGTLTQVMVEGAIRALNSNSNVGGLIGKSQMNVSKSVVIGNVSSSGSDSNAGGLIGYSEGVVTDSYCETDVTGTLYTAGLVAYSKSAIISCYSVGNVTGIKYGAGIVAQLDGVNAKVSKCVALNRQLTYSDQSSWASRVIGGYKNSAPDPDNSNYALKTMQVTLNGVATKKYDDLVEGIGKEESVLQTKAFYQILGWDMTETWGIDEGTGYPYLSWAHEPEEPAYIVGDANGDNKVTVLDYLGIAKYILQGAFDGFNVQAADVNDDGKITVLDYLGVAKIILNGSLNSNRRVNAAAVDLSNDCLTADAADGVLAIGLNNAGDYSMYQLDVTLPTDAELIDVEGTERMSSNHTIEFAHQYGTTWRILVGSRSLATVNGSEGDILRLNVSGLTDGEIIIDNAEFVTPALVSTTMRPLCVSIGEPTGISTFSLTSADEIYNMQGVRVNVTQLTPGVYVVNGKKYVVK